MVYNLILKLLKSSGAKFTIYEHPAVCTIEDARQKAAHLTHNLLKTVVFKIKNSHWILAAVDCSDRIHYKKLGDALAVKRTDLRSVSPRDVQSELGFEVGGVGPFPVGKNVKVVIDQNLAGRGKIFCGSGKNTRTVEIELDDLIKLSKARVYAISKQANLRV